MGELEQTPSDLVPDMWLFRTAIGGDYMTSDSFAFSAEEGVQYRSARSETWYAVDVDGDGWPGFDWRNVLDVSLDATFVSVGATFYF